MAKRLATPTRPREEAAQMSRITPFLWYDRQAREAAELYVSVFDDARITEVTHYGEAGPGETGSVMTVSFELEGQPFVALNGGPHFKFDEAVSFAIDCETQEKVDYLWERLSEGGEKGRCGWLKDRFGLSWQVVPTILDELMTDEDPERARRVTEAMLKMTKLEIAELRRAYDA
jgi:predicted 3-demethylubiquinone-9 3-methyltransferase (glyoxalase superfamily)